MSSSTDLMRLIAVNDKISEVIDRCPKCLIGIVIDNGPMSGAVSGSARFDKDNSTMLYVFANPYLDSLGTTVLGPSIYSNSDIIGFSFYQSEYTSENNSICNDSTKNDILLEKLKEVSANIRWGWSKSPIVINLAMDTTTSCWQKETDPVTGVIISNPEYDFYKYLWLKQTTLAKTGMLGIFYKDANNFEVWNGDYRDEYCTIQKASRSYRSDKPLTVYSKVYVAENVTCIACSNLDISLGICNEHCMNNVTCVLPPNANMSIQYRCPQKALPEPCTLCSNTNYQLNCTIEYANGSTQNVGYNTSTFEYLWGDRIAAIPEPYKCCVNDSTGNFTYAMEITSGAQVAPIVFPTDPSDPTQDCGIPELDKITSGLCSLSIPIKNYKIRCEIE